MTYSLNSLLLILLISLPFFNLKAQYRRGAIPLRKSAIEVERATNVGRLGLTISNYGTLGDGFVTQNPDLPSAEFPLGSGIEHMFSAGLWVGAKTKDGKTLVTT